MRDRRGPSRRDFLKGVGAAGAGLVAGTVGGGAELAGSASAGVPPVSPVSPVSPRSYAKGAGGAPASSVDFGRMFPNLPPFAQANDTVRAALLEVGQPGGILDARDDLAAGPTRLIIDPSVNGNPTGSDPYGSNPDNPTMTAGSTFVGQCAHILFYNRVLDELDQFDLARFPAARAGQPTNPYVASWAASASIAV